jgi:hypothetical protein
MSFPSKLINVSNWRGLLYQKKKTFFFVVDFVDDDINKKYKYSRDFVFVGNCIFDVAYFYQCYIYQIVA